MDTAKGTLKFLKQSQAEAISSNPIFKETFNELIHKYKALVAADSPNTKKQDKFIQKVKDFHAAIK